MGVAQGADTGDISIHALLAESDQAARNRQREIVISIHALLAESDRMYQLSPKTKDISIHALLAESDVFLLRKITITVDISIHALLAESDAPRFTPAASRRNFYPRSPCGERLFGRILSVSSGLFLSTLSLRRATPRKTEVPGAIEISIHALLAESDFVKQKFNTSSPKFLSTLSLRRATLCCLP